jgi:hypothetical protein
VGLSILAVGAGKGGAGGLRRGGEGSEWGGVGWGGGGGWGGIPPWMRRTSFPVSKPCQGKAVHAEMPSSAFFCRNTTPMFFFRAHVWPDVLCRSAHVRKPRGQPASPPARQPASPRASAPSEGVKRLRQALLLDCALK